MEAEYSLSKNFSRPSNVCANPAIEVPTAANRVWMMPKMILKRCWTRPRMPLKTEVMALMMEPMRSVMELVTEGMLESGRVFCYNNVIFFFWVSK